MKLHFVESMDEVLKIALERELVALPMPAGAPAWKSRAAAGRESSRIKRDQAVSAAHPCRRFSLPSWQHR